MDIFFLIMLILMVSTLDIACLTLSVSVLLIELLKLSQVLLFSSRDYYLLNFTLGSLVTFVLESLPCA